MFFPVSLVSRVRFLVCSCIAVTTGTNSYIEMNNDGLLTYVWVIPGNVCVQWMFWVQGLTSCSIHTVNIWFRWFSCHTENLMLRFNVLGSFKTEHRWWCFFHESVFIITIQTWVVFFSCSVLLPKQAPITVTCFFQIVRSTHETVAVIFSYENDHDS